MNIYVNSKVELGSLDKETLIKVVIKLIDNKIVDFDIKDNTKFDEDSQKWITKYELTFSTTRMNLVKELDEMVDKQ